MQQAVTKNRKGANTGFSLVEILVALALMGTLLVSLSVTVMRTNTIQYSYFKRNQAGIEIYGLYDDLRTAINNSSLHPKATRYNLVLRSHNPNAYLQTYRIESGNLKYASNATDAANTGATWRTPYRISGITSYTVSGEFLYCGYDNNCTRFPDANGNGQWDGAGTDGAASVPAPYTGTALSSPADAKKVVLFGFNFDRGQGNPQVVRSLPSTYITLGPALTDPGTETGNALVRTLNFVNIEDNDGADIREAVYDENWQSFISVGGNGGTNARIRVFDPCGAQLRSSKRRATWGPGVTWWFPTNTGGFTLVAARGDGLRVYWLDPAGGIGVGLSTYNLRNGDTERFSYVSGMTGSTQAGLAQSAYYPDLIHVLGQSGGTYKIFAYDKDTSLISGTAMNLPTALANGTNVGGMFIEPISGHFYILDRTPYTSGGDTYMNLYHVDPANSTVADTIPINLTRIGAPTTLTTWAVAYNPINNHLYLQHRFNDVAYEILPPRLLTVRQ